MSKKGENIYKRKDGRWEGRYIQFYVEKGKAKYGYVYGKTYSDVKRKIVEKKASSYCSPQLLLSGTSVYNDVLDAWLQSSRINIKESTYARYVHLINAHIRPQLGKYQLSMVSTQLIESFIEGQLHKGKLDNSGGLSTKTVTDILTIVKSTVEYAKYNNIAVSCNLSKLTITEQDLLLQVLLTDMDLYKFGVLLSLYTGIRIGELCALQWENLSIVNSTLKIRKTMQRIQDTNIGATSQTKVIITEPKSNCSIRDIPLPAFLVEIAERFSSNPKAFVLSGERGKYVEPRTMQNHFKKYIAECGIENANFHSLRHTFATRCIEVGFDIKSLSEILGHSNVNITLNRYVHSSFELKCSNMNKLEYYKPSNKPS